ncbi:MAG: trypsin-like peptidase domain-containing protein [Candidatus Nomurabacteria bacterium]|jgi:S1-C subfamily serine protease|nr:trypsin-like peptidase domain-containing protein [Candidatus Nomurabacteria bacterium]
MENGNMGSNMEVPVMPVVPKFGKVPEKQKEKTGRGGDKGFKRFVTVACCLAVVLSGGAATISVINMVNGSQPAAVIDRGDSGNYYDGNSMQFEDTTIASVVTKVSSAVVSILTETQVRGYFGQSQMSEGAGTGMIVTTDGYVITNSHVIDGADTVAIVTDSGDTYENVEVVGVDPLNDVAYLKIPNVKDLPTVILGDSKTISTGQPVLAIGNALGVYQNSITQGIISGTGRTITASDSSGQNSETLSDMIQTDAAINPGNSGGPLVNAAGEVIGINTAVSTDAQGLGFAIPISSTKGMLKSIVERGKAERAYLGVNYIAITADVAKEYDLPVTQGAYIYSGGGKNPVVSGTPADKAGIKSKDIILEINGVPVGSKGSILSLVGEYAPNEEIKLVVLRDGREVSIDLILGAYPIN